MIEDHKTSNDPLQRDVAGREPPPDAIEIWGKRIGRTLGVLFALFLIWRLVATYVFAPA